MKKISLLLSMVCLCFTTFASEKQKGYNLAGISYENTYVSATDNIFAVDPDVTSLSLNGFGVEYIRGIGITHLPMFIEVGGKLTFTFNNQSFNTSSGSYEKYDYSTVMGRLIIPVSYAYKFSFGDKLSVTPYAGFNFKFNLLGLSKETHEYSYKYGSNKYDIVHVSDKENYSWFDKEDVYELSGVKNGTWNRVQVGWHLGGRVQYSRLYASLSYGTDMNSIFNYKKNILNTGVYANEHWFTGNFSLTVGMSF